MACYVGTLPGKDPMKRWLILAFLCTGQVAMAETLKVDDARACIQRSVQSGKESMTNTCDRQIVVIWCHDRDQQGYRNGLCGKGKNFFRMNRTLEPGEALNNPFSLPLGANIPFGACFGGYGSFKRLEQEGQYLCKPEPIKAAVEISSASAPSKALACEKARAMANGNDLGTGMPGDCECTPSTRAKRVTCRVKSLSKPRDASVLEKARQGVRETLATCDPAKDRVCPVRNQTAQGNGGSGLRD